MNRAPVLAIESLTVVFHGERGSVRAVDGASLELRRGEILGLVGESGSGKSVTCLAAMGLLSGKKSVDLAGRILYGEENLLAAGEARLRALRGDRLTMIFQDPMTALNPYLTVGRQIAEVLETKRGASRAEAMRAAERALGDCGIAAPERRVRQYPHHFSGGMRQRVMIAMALATKPDILFADEPTTALDVTTQKQILGLIGELCRTIGTAVVFVTHDLAVAAEIADRIAVLYAGRIAEEAPAAALFERPLHPYTRGLLASIPRLDGVLNERFATIPGRPPDLIARSPGCAFAPRCPEAVDACLDAVPQPESAGPGHRVACPPALARETTP